MTGVRIVARTAKGQSTIKRMLQSPDDDRVQRFFKETVESTEPYTIIVEHRNAFARRIAPAAYMLELIHKGMAKAGAATTDYELVEV